MKEYKIVLSSLFKSEIDEICTSTLIDTVKADTLSDAMQEAYKIVELINKSNVGISYFIQLIEPVK